LARYYCPTAHETFSLLPDCLASRFPSDLDDLERVTVQVATHRSVEAAADVSGRRSRCPSAVAVDSPPSHAGPHVGGPGRRHCSASTWDRHRLAAFRAAWETDRVLVARRSRVAAHLPILPPPPRLRSARAASCAVDGCANT